MPSKDRYFCRVCGLKQVSPPWGEGGETPSFEICECCGVEFGYEDSTLAGIRSYRAGWLDKGARWFKPRLKPPGWDAAAQLQNVPPEYK
jgi:hypothetical protein